MNKKKKFKLKKSAFRKFLFIFVIFIILVIVLSFTIKLQVLLFSKEVEKSFVYSDKGTMEHKVYYKNNAYIDEKIINDATSYVTSLVDYMNVKLTYEFTSSVLGDFDYNYKITAKVITTEKGDNTKVLYQHEDLLYEDKLGKPNSNSISINSAIKLDFANYNALVTSFKKNYVIAVDSKLIVTATINIHGQKEGFDEEINEIRVSSISMPLAEQTVTIDRTNSSLQKSDSIVKYKDKSDFYKEYRKYVNLLYIVDTVLFLILSVTVFFLIPKRKKYHKKLQKILRSYDDLIVTVKSLPDINSLSIIEVETFNELLDAREALQKPIVHYESSHNDASIFMITTENEAFIYQLNAYGKDD